MTDGFDLLIVGGGPTGLACGIEAERAALRYRILEKGCLVNSLFSYPPTMTFFTTRERLEIGDIPFSSVNLKPTRAEALEYYRRVTDHYKLAISYHHRVAAIRGASPDFTVAVERPTNGRCELRARAVIIATGYYDLPNLLGIPGEDLPKVSHYYLEAHAFHQQRVLVIGGANSAAVAGLDLFRHGAEVTLSYRAGELSRHIKYWLRPDLENRIKEKSIRALFRSEVTEIGPDWVAIRTASGETTRLGNDFVFALTGYHPDVDLLRDSGVEVDPVSCRPKCNPKTLESNVSGLYLAGVVISGRHTNEIFIENGRFHGKQIVEDLRSKLCARAD